MCLSCDETLVLLERQSIGIAFRKSDELAEFLSNKKRDLGGIESEQAPDVPSIPNWVIAIVVVLGFSILFGKLRKPDPTEDRSGEGMIALMAGAIMVLYIACLQLGLPYGMVTTPALFLLSATLAGWQRTKLIPIAQLALFFGLGSEFVFTTLFSVPLP